MKNEEDQIIERMETLLMRCSSTDDPYFCAMSRAIEYIRQQSATALRMERAIHSLVKRIEVLSENEKS